MKHTFIIAEAGINHNGSLDLAKKLIDTAVIAGADAVKFQKRDIHEVYDPDTLSKTRESPWGTTYLQQKEGIEFSEEDFDYINDYCRKNGIEWFVSCWDLNSQKFMRRYDLKYNKVASPMLTVTQLLEEIASEGKHTFISTGMSTLEEIDAAVEIFKKHDCPFELMHCVSAYPLDNSTANLNMIHTLRRRYAKNVGYSGHEKGLQISLAAVAMGATSVERHITLDRSMYGSDQAASIEPDGLIRLVRDIRIIDAAMGTGEKILNDFEQVHRDKLATPYWVTKIGLPSKMGDESKDIVCGACNRHELPMKHVDKGWGWERWIVNNEEYCGKLLFFNAGKRCSWHYHKLKDEVFYLQTGKMMIYYSKEDDLGNAKQLILNAGDNFHVYRGLRHQMVALEDSELFEFSTTHYDTDSYRIVKGD